MVCARVEKPSKVEQANLARWTRHRVFRGLAAHCTHV